MFSPWFEVGKKVFTKKENAFYFTNRKSEYDFSVIVMPCCLDISVSSWRCYLYMQLFLPNFCNGSKSALCFAALNNNSYCLLRVCYVPGTILSL